MKTSALITVYNRPEMAAACLRALALGSVLVDEAVVSDDGSEGQCVRKMQEVFSELPFPVRYVRQEHAGYRLAAARNNAIRAATGDYLISIDGDMLLMPDAVSAHLERARPGVFLAGSRALLGGEATRRALEGSLDRDALEARWEGADKRHLARDDFRFRRNLFLRRLGLASAHKPKILGCHFSLFRADAEKVNGFDEHFAGWGLEDDDFARRLYLAGVRGRAVIKSARALHLQHASVASKPAKIGESPNMAYFSRRDVPFYCAEGLNKAGRAFGVSGPVSGAAP